MEKEGLNNLTVMVTDADGIAANATQTISVNPPPSLALGANVSGSAIYLNETIHIDANATGGIPPYTYAMQINGKEVNYTSSLSFNKPGNYSVNVTAKDSEGMPSSKTLQFEVVNKGDYLPLVAIPVVLAILAVYYILRMKTRNRRTATNKRRKPQGSRRVKG